VYGTYLAARLKADPMTGGLHSVLSKASAALATAHARERKAQSDLQEVQSARDYADFLMDQLLGEFESAVYAVAKRDRSHPLYVRLIPKPVSKQVRTLPAEQVVRVASIEKDLAEAGIPEVLKPWLAKLADQRVKVEKAIAAWREAWLAHSTALYAEVNERSRWLHTYRSIHADLVKMFPGERKKIDSFFRPIRTARRDESPPSAEAVSPTAETKVIAPKAGEEGISAA
jgi:hypothetical protein